ncbi:MAG: hypothetical protein OXC80_00265 [Gammaproteobacteria bacterium]|nr:hypothetical protein [Gammaproteobacteria bacterium]
MNNQDVSSLGQNHLKSQFPKLDSLFDSVGPLTYPEAPDIHLLDAIARVVNSQMLSTHAAKAILDRLEQERKATNAELLVELSDEKLRACGWSRSKVKTLRLFAESYRLDSERFERWRSLPFEELEPEVKSCWGISTWTAEMLAIFYFNNRDVFPKFDLAINRAVERFSKIDTQFEPARASPHQTLLAMYMWASYRTDYWETAKENF